MTVALYMDVHVRKSVTLGLRIRQVDVLTAQEDGARQLFDPALLDRSTALGRVLFTQDKGFLAEAAHRQQAGQFFAGIVFAPQQTVTVGRCVHDLELLAKACDPVDLANQVIYLPIR